jgi:hypothetical protein
MAKMAAVQLRKKGNAGHMWAEKKRMWWLQGVLVLG